MKSIAIWLFLFACFHVCISRGQVPGNASDGKDPPAQRSDIDPYFAESSFVESEAGPKAIARNVLQDRQGRFWLATWNGIVRYDGKVFTNVTNKEALRRYRTFSLLEDRENNIWIGTVGAGVYRFDGNAYTNLTMKDGLVDNAVLSMLQDRDGNLWFGCMGASKYDGKTFTSFTEADGFTSFDVNSISQAADGTIWFGTRGALFHYDGKQFVDFTKQHELNIVGYIPTLIDQNGILWFGGEAGVFRFDGKQLQHLFKSACYSLLEDSKGRIWFSGGIKGGGPPPPGVTLLNRFDPQDGFENMFDASRSFEIKGGRGIFGLTEDQDGRIWFGTGKGVGRIEGDEVRYL